MATAPAETFAPASFPELAAAIPVTNLATALLVERILARGEARLSARGAVTAVTGEFTGRTPTNKFIVKNAPTASTVAWGKVNQPISPEVFEKVRRRMAAYVKGREVFVQDCHAGADPAYRLRVRVVTELAWHSLFVHQLFLRPAAQELIDFVPDFTIVAMPGCRAVPAEDGTTTGTYILVDFERRLILIGGTYYAGEMKKSIFGVLNFLLPARGVFPMHCSANVGPDGDTALFFGLSGTGKTTLSADSHRRLIGDDEHGWGDHGVFNFEGGCYAKCIRLSLEQEPQIWNAIRFGSVLENVAVDPRTRRLNFDSDELTENTRAAYPLEFIEGSVVPGVGGHPRNVVLLTADAFGVLPPISKLTPEQTMYHFLSGYTAKVAGTERGLGNEPEATFSACFGGPFLPRPAAVYAGLLGEKLRRHDSRCWLVNTGWTGGPYGVGERMKLKYTRAMLRSATAGDLDYVPTVTDPVFGLAVPSTCPGVPPRFLDARGMWADKDAYDRAARDLSVRFNKNFAKFKGVAPEVAAAAPVLR
jgi:phosphoenolpyruvate carboxykinase (ATP)